MEQHSNALITRVERLERSSRRMKLVGLAGIAAIIAMGASSGIPHTFDSLSAHAINIVDANGKLRVAIGADPSSDDAGKSVNQRDGVTRATFGIDSSGNAGTTFSDHSGSLRTAMGALSDDTRVIGTFEPSGVLGAYLFSIPGMDGFNGLFVDQPDGVQRANVFAASGASFMQLLNPTFGGIGFNDAGNGSRSELNIIDSNGISRLTVAATEISTGNPFELVRITGPDGIDRALMQSGFGTNNGLVETYDSAGTPTGLLGTP